MTALVLSGLSKTYQNGVQALNNINLKVAEGDFFALLGANGAGKSTTIGVISSLVNKTEGSVTIFGCDLDSEKEKAKSYLGLVPQEFNFNGFEQVKHILLTQAGYYGISPQQAQQRADALLQQLGLWDKRNSTARSLSGGMKRRLMIARALIHQPKLLILDEPTAGVDIELRRSMWAFLQQINQQGTTIILTTHYLEEAENLCRNIAIIDQGQIIEDTDMKSLLNRLDKQTFIFDLVNPLPHDVDLSSLHYQVIDQHTIEVELSKEQLLNDIFEQFNRQHIAICSMKNKANRLEELFLDLVEKSETN